MLIFIIGYMGSGKTTFGKRLAGVLGYRFLDLDELIISRSESPIIDLFEKQGEEKFRLEERKMLLEHLTGKDTVIATGGGTASYADNMDVMNANGLTVFLDMSDENILKRLLAEKQQRPLLKNVEDAKMAEYIREHLHSRMGYYEKARIRVKVDDLNEEEIHKMITECIQ